MRSEDLTSMNSFCRFIMITTILVHSSCSNHKEGSLQTKTSLPSKADKHYMINNQGDTIPTGVPIPARSTWIPADSLPPPKGIPLPANPRTVKGHAHLHKAGQPKVIPLSEDLILTTPGKDGFALPDTVAFDVNVAPAYHSKPVTAGSFKMRENAATNVQYLGVEEGLSYSVTWSLLEDSRGILWFGNSDCKLNRYDGHSFTYFHPPAEDYQIGLTPRSLYEDEQGNIWSGTFAGLARYDGTNFTYYSIDCSNSPGAGNKILQDRNGFIWFTTSVMGAGRFNPKLSEKSAAYFGKAQGLCSNNIQSVVEDSDGAIWIGAEDGCITRFDGHAFTHYHQLKNADADPVLDIMEAANRDLWFATRNGGAWHFSSESFTNYSTETGLSSNHIRKIFEDSKGNIWFCTLNGAICKYDGSTFYHYTESSGTNSSHAYDIIEDSHGNILVATGEGIHRFGITKFTHFNNELDNLHIENVVEDQLGNIWFGILGQTIDGVIRYDGEVFTHFKGDERGLEFFNSEVSCSILRKNGDLVFGTMGSGFTQFDGRSFTQIVVGSGAFNVIRSIWEDTRGNLWMCTDEGITRYDGIGFTYYFPEKLRQWGVFLSLIEDHQKNIWIGTPEYLCRFDGATFTYFTVQEGLPNYFIRDLLLNDRGQLWIATNNGAAFSDGVRFTNFTLENGLTHNIVTDIIEDREQRVWITTQNGISLLVRVGSYNRTKTDFRDIKVFNFASEDGLKQGYFKDNEAYLDSRNRLWWAKTRGAMMLDLNDFELPSKPPRIYLDHIDMEQEFVDFRKLEDSVYRASLPFGSALAGSFDSVTPFFNYPTDMELPYHINHLTFHFSAIDWTAPHQIRYSYKLEGEDEAWSAPQKTNTADYRNLRYGDYTLKVKAIGAAQTWSEPFEYSFAILPPFWLTWWAYCLYVIFGVLMLTALYLYQKRRWQLQTNLQMEHQKAEQLEELDHFKSQFYTNITHEFRTPLTVIMGMAEQLKENGKVKKMIRNNTERLLNMVNQLMNLSKLESGSLAVYWVHGDIISYLNYLTESCHSLAQDKTINLSFFSKEEVLRMDYDENKLQQILTNLLTNAIKFTPEYGSVKVIVSRISKDGQPFMELTVKDTGEGIPEHKLPHIFDRFYQADDSATRNREGSGIGLSLVRELVQLLEGSIEVNSEPNKGSSFTVYLPIRANGIEEGSNDYASLIITENENANTKKPGIFSRSKDTDAEKPIVLIIEDNADVIDYIVSCLNSGYHTHSARNGQEGVEKAMEIIPDSIICDVMMPQMDGFEVCKKLKSDTRTSHIPIILLTAKATQMDKITGLSHGADVYLTKPFDKKELLVRLNNLATQSKLLQKQLSDPGYVGGEHQISGSAEAAFLNELQKIMEAELENELFDTNYLCREIGMSRTQLHRKLKALTGKSTASYMRSFRLHKAKSLVEDGDLPIGEVASRVGYKDFSHFSRSYFKEFGHTPSETRK